MPSFCAHYDRGHCRSCSWIERDYGEQLLAKEAAIRAGLGGRVRLETAFASVPQGFRNRAKMSVTGTSAAPIIGLTGESELDQGRELLDCPIHHPRLNELITALPAWIARQGIAPYQIQARVGELKGLIAFYSPGSREMYLRLILRSESAIPAIRAGLAELSLEFPDLVCISVNLQPIPHAILEGPQEIVLTQRKSIHHRVGHLALKLAPQAFVQTNVDVATELYATSARWIAERPDSRMMELYCGQGAFSFFAAPHVSAALGIEINADAVATAQATARELGFQHIEFRTADATRVGHEINGFRPDLILVNPPRRGVGADGVKLILESGVERVIYSSCSIESLARDAASLQGNYRIQRARLFDLFPHTAHF